MNSLTKIFCALAILLMISLLGIEYTIYQSGKNEFSSDAEYIIVLGAKLHGKRPSRSLLYRMDKAVYYLKKEPKMKLIATGGQGSDEDISEGEAIRQYAVSKGISSDRIIVEDKSTNTYENFKFSRKLLNKHGKIKINVVSNRYHILRSKILASRNGFIPYGVPAKTPSSVVISSYLRESAALVKSFFFDK